jgi:hypothetical protein
MEVVKLFMNYPQLYSWEYVTLMKTQLSPSGRHCMPNITVFLDILSLSQVTFSVFSFPMLLEKFFDLKGGSLSQIKAVVNELLNSLDAIDMGVLLSSIEVAISVGSTAVVIENIHKGRSLTTKEQVLAQILLDNKEE